MKALVISGGGSKGAYAGGVAHHLIVEQAKHYNLLIGTSTGSLLLPHLALGKAEKLKSIYTNVNPKDIFNINPFIVKRKGNREYVAIKHWNVLWQLMRNKRTFGESKNLRRNISRNFTLEEFNTLKKSNIEIVVTVSNLTKNVVEYKRLKDHSYDDFCDWMWISANYVPFMSLVTKNGCEYADGGFGAVSPIREAIRRGAKEVDAVILEAENMEHNIVLGKNPFSLMVNLFGFVIDQIEYHNIAEGKLAALAKDVELNLYYTPTKLTENSLIFDKTLMTNWWQRGFDAAAKRIASSKVVFNS
ncbi:MAG: patatin-like phospholipase family protein [Flavobacteriaceae bacterium]|nr:patatin-like phospholipase family protein [Flavobacteriaceae bacterium]